MKEYVRFKKDGNACYGLLDGSIIRVLNGQYPDEFSENGQILPTKDVKLLAPVNPRKIVGLGLNYNDIVLKEGESLPERPKIFLKSPQAVIIGGENIEKPDVSNYVTAECELGVVIGRCAKDVRAADAMDYVFGYICADDFTASDLQKLDGLWGRAKNFDTFCPVSDRIVCGIDPFHVKLRAYRNGELCIDGCTDRMIFPIPAIIEYITSFLTLMPGDLILTGVPTGYGVEAKTGDIIKVEAEGIGSVENKVVGKN